MRSRPPTVLDVRFSDRSGSKRWVNQEPTVSKETKSGLELGFLISTGAIGLGLLHAFGYWGTFGINPLEHVSLADAAKLAMYQLGPALLTLLISIAASALIGAALGLAFVGLKHGARTVWSEHKRWLLPSLASFAGFAIIAWLALTRAGVVAVWLIVVAIALQSAWVVAIYRNRETIRKEVVKNIPNLAFAVLPTLYVGLVFVSGRLIAIAAVYPAFGTTVVEPPPESLGLAAGPCEPVYYLGRLGDIHAFRASNDSNVALVPINHFDRLVLSVPQANSRLEFFTQRGYSGCVLSASESHEAGESSPPTTDPDN